ncbi:unnamed protein product [Ambrosiozyma monospora]|uniref:Unnamed protein product n=1 Tax=Ambrosiozyma monospora TaxID=43982 RepID=A0A9W6YUI7_AMBMO|nr:unnamed protein product [Ambrosiozyma monospora]
MSAFNDYCLVCEKICSSNQIYCCDECRQLDQNPDFSSPTLSSCSNESINGAIYTTHSHCSASNANGNAGIPGIISPLLTPQFNYNHNYYNTSATNASNFPSMYLKSPHYNDMVMMNEGYSTTPMMNQFDLDCNRLDLNVCCDNTANSTSHSHEAAYGVYNKSSSETSSKNVTNVSDALANCASENYKRWLSHL